MKDIDFQSIDHSDHRYPTIGDYWETPDTLFVRVSSMLDVRYEQLVLIHEMVEIFLLQNRGIVLKETDDFDILFEKERQDGKHGPNDEPGDDPRCPYRSEHRFAENIERQLCHALSINWSDYEKYCESLP